MKRMDKIKERISSIIHKEELHTLAEIEELRRNRY